LNPILKVTIGVLILGAASLVTLGVLITDLTEKSFYDESGKVSVNGLSRKVTVSKDNFGVSHISASNESDMYFALGYMHAQDRLWQMDISRRVAEGRLSEIMGQDVLMYDKLFRTLGINKMASVLYEKISPKSRELLTRYADGVNSFIENHSKILPLEFDVLNYKPEQWKPEHSLMIVRLMAWELNIAWYTDYTFGEIVNRFGLDRGTDFFPDYPVDAPHIIKGDTTLKKQAADTVKEVSHHNLSPMKDISGLGEEFYNTVLSFRKFYGSEGMQFGSNSWVVNGSKSENGKPILANDPHLALQVPSKWYEVDLHNEQLKRNISGFSIPGAPAVVIGANSVISWGITNLMNDDSDFYVFDLEPGQPGKYRYKDTVLMMDSTVESIKIKGQKDEVSFTTYRTHLGPVISGIEKTGFRSKQKLPLDPARILTFRWTGYDVSDEVNAFYKINNALNWDEFKNALKDFGAPGSNFTYADTMGNIGYRAAGNIPIREGAQTDFALMFPSRGEIEWKGYVPFDEMPQSYNPKEGYIVTANNKPKADYKYYISNIYEPGYRAQRIESILKPRGSFSADEFKLIQHDIYSLHARELCGYLFEAVKDPSKLNANYAKYLKVLKDWDFKMVASSPAATLYAQFEIELYRNLYKDALGEELFTNYIYIKNIPVRNTSKLLKENKSWLFNNTADSRESPRDGIIRKSFTDAIETLSGRYGQDHNNWLWGEHHKVLMMHPLGVVPALSSILNIGPYDIGGSGTTVSMAEYSFTKALQDGKYEAFLGPSMRMVIDMSNPRVLYTINSTGQSGQPIHPNFRDQARLWLNGEYKTVITNPEKLAAEKLNVLTIEPK
jgi:penicillin amidase